MTESFLAVGEAAQFHGVLPRSSVMPLPPRFVFGAFPAEVAAHYFSTQSVFAVGTYAAEKFELCDGYTLRQAGQLVFGPDLKIYPKHLTDIDPARRAGYADRPRRRLPGTTALIIGPGYQIFGHWMAEFLPRLAVLAACGHDIEALTFAVPADTPRFGLELMTLFGVPPGRIETYGANEVLQPDNLLLPTLINGGVRYAPLLADAVARFKRQMVRAGHSLELPGGPPRIFLTRGRGNRRLENRAIIEAMARAARFTLVRPETMSLPTQIALFGGAREIIGEYGSAFHTALFSPPGTVLCGLRGSHTHPGFLQSGIGEVLDQPTGYCFGQNAQHEPNADYTVPEQVFSDCLRIVFSRRHGLAARSAAISAPLHPALATA